MELSKALESLRAFTEDTQHVILDHKEKYHFDDLSHRWHLNNHPPGGPAEHAPELMAALELGFQAKPLAAYLGGSADSTMILPPPKLKQLDLMLPPDPEEQASNMRHLGHVAGYFLGNTGGAMKIDPYHLSEIHHEVAADEHYQDGFRHGVNKIMESKGNGYTGYDLGGLFRYHTNYETLAEIGSHLGGGEIAKTYGFPGNAIPQDIGDTHQWMQDQGLDGYSPADGENSLKYVKEEALLHGIKEDVIDSWLEREYPGWDQKAPDNTDDLDSWAEGKGHDISTLTGFMDATRVAENAGFLAPAIGSWVEGKVNTNLSAGGLVNDTKYAQRVYDPEKATEGARSMLGVPEEASTADYLSGDLDNGFAALREAVHASHDQLIGMEGWMSDPDVHQSDSADAIISAGDHLPHPDKLRFLRDAGRFVDRTGDEARYVLGDSDFDWVFDKEYRPTRYTTVPRADGHTRLQREDEMQIGRVNYAALGFDAPGILPKIQTNNTTGLVLDEWQHPDADYADFNVRGYGEVVCQFRGVQDEKPSHAVNDTYYDTRYCMDGGHRALLPNAASFARGQQDMDRLIYPNNAMWEYGPNFVELHPGPLQTSNLSRVDIPNAVNWSRLHREPMHNHLGSSRAERFGLHTTALTYLHLQGSEFYPSDMQVIDSRGRKTSIEESEDGKKVTEAEARERVDRAVELVQKMGNPRVQLHLPFWYR